MDIVFHQSCVEVLNINFSVKNTFDCGQCFRFFPSGNANEYSGVAFGKQIRITQLDNGMRIHSGAEDFNQYWRSFLDIDLDYDSISNGFPNDDFTKAAIAHGSGLRIIRQEPWEALCSFIISQCNNIKRIQSIIKTMCQCFGEEIAPEVFAFPTPYKLAELNVDDLAPLRCGYRAPYIIAAAKAVVAGEIDFETLEHMPTLEARKAVMALEGVGGKVADCFLLFGLHKLDAFPVDTWMKKASVHYKQGFDATAFGEYAGIAQQYIFFYAREGKIGKSH